jgi:electron transfer flavoprotein beta subunit
MKVLVPIKRVIDFSTRIRLKTDGSGVETNNVKMTMNPFDEIAIEEAVRLKEKNIIQEIIVVSIGSETCQETIRTALAMGADRGILVQTQEALQPLAIAKILKTMALKELPQLIILGKQAVDDDNNQAGQMLAGLLNWSQGTFASKLIVADGTVQVTREIDTGLETLLLKLPAVITTDLRLNEPRYLSLPNIVQAKRKSIEVLALSELAIPLTNHLQILKMVEPERRRSGIRLQTVAELVDKLRHEAQVIS